MTFSGESKISRLPARVTFLKSCSLCQQKANFVALKRSCLLWEQKKRILNVSLGHVRERPHFLWKF